MECHKIANLKGLNFPAHLISCLTELPLYCLIIYIDGIFCDAHIPCCFVLFCFLLLDFRFIDIVKYNLIVCPSKGGHPS